MKAKQLQDSDIAKLISNVTQPIIGKRTELASGPQEEPVHFISLPIHGVPGLLVFMATSDKGLAELSSAMFGVHLSAVDQPMMRDTLGELANMAAGQIKSAVDPSHVLGLPSDKFAREVLHNARHVNLKAGDIPLRVYLLPATN